MRGRPRQLELQIRSWGGRRRGAGHTPSPGRRRVAHRRRPVHDARCPVHVTLRAAAGLPSLRADRAFGPLRTALRAASGPAFRLLHFSVQADHLHLLVEADGHAGLVRGLQGLTIRLAKALNRALGRRGTVWGDRYHVRVLRTPREVRAALVYVLQNWKKHVTGARGRDPRSSAAWFTGWRTGGAVGVGAAPVAAARTWLARVGWHRHGLIEVAEAPRDARQCRRGSSP